MADVVSIVPFVEGKFTQAQGFASSAYQTTMEALLALEQIAEQLTLINRLISIDTTTVSGSTIAATPPSIDISQFRVDMPSLPPDPQLISAEMETLPNFPDLVVGDLQPPNETYTSSLLTAIQAKLLSDIQNGSTGLTPAVEDAIFSREYERSILVEQDLEDGIAADWSGRSWPLPSGALKAGIDQAKINFSNKRLDMSRDVSIKSFELALQNYHFIIQQGIGLESELIKYAHSVAVLAFQAADAGIKNIIAAFSERRQEIRDKVAAILDKAKTKIQYNLGLIEMFTAKINGYSAYIRGQSDRVNAVARGYEAETAVFKAVTDFDISKAGLDLKVLETRINQAIANAGLMIKDKEIEQKNYELLNTLKVEAMKAVGAIAAQLVAGALSSAHAQASIGATQSDDVNAIEVANINAAAKAATP